MVAYVYGSRVLAKNCQGEEVMYPKLTLQNIIILGAVYYFLFMRNKKNNGLDYLKYGDGYEGIYGGDS